jgi:hypothetical protein
MQPYRQGLNEWCHTPVIVAVVAGAEMETGQSEHGVGFVLLWQEGYVGQALR